MIGIAEMEFAPAPTFVSLASLAATLDPADVESVRHLGIRQVAVADGLTGHDLAARAARAALARRGLAPADLDILVHVPGRVPAAFMASELTRVQAAIGARNALALSVGDLGCASSTSALMVLDALLRRDPARGSGMISMAAVTPTPYRYRRPVTVNGDGGMAVLVTNDRPVFILRGLAQSTDGEFWDLFSVEYQEKDPARWREACRNETDYTFGLAVRSLTMARELAATVLARSGADWPDVSHVVTQNLSRSSFDFYSQALGRPISSVCAANLAEFGHLGPLDVFLNLRSLEPLTRPGDLALVINNSPVAAWTAALFEKAA